MCGHMTFFRGVTKKIPVLTIIVRQFQEENLLQIGDFWRQQISMLIPDLPGACPKDERRSNHCWEASARNQRAFASAGAVDDEAGGELWEKATAAEQIAINRRAKERIRRMKPPCNETKNNLYNTILQAQ